MISFKYRDKGTPIYKLNPLSKIAWVLAIFVTALIINNPLFLLGLFLSTLPFVALADIWKEWSSFIKLALFICIAIIVINPLVTYNGSTILTEAPFSVPVIGTPVITLEAIVFGVGMSIKLLAIISAFTVLTLTVNPDDLMRSIIKLKLPYKSVLVTSLSTRFVPTLIADVERITDAQRTRGIEFNKGRFYSRIKRSVSVLIPLLSNSLDRAYQVSEAMEARAFGNCKNRTFYKDMLVTPFDVTTIVIGLTPLIMAISLVVTGYGNYEYYPSLSKMQLSVYEWAMLPTMMILASALAFVSFLKRRYDLD